MLSLLFVDIGDDGRNINMIFFLGVLCVSRIDSTASSTSGIVNTGSPDTLIMISSLSSNLRLGSRADGNAAVAFFKSKGLVSLSISRFKPRLGCVPRVEIWCLTEVPKGLSVNVKSG